MSLNSNVSLDRFRVQLPFCYVQFFKVARFVLEEIQRSPRGGSEKGKVFSRDFSSLGRSVPLCHWQNGERDRLKQADLQKNLSLYSGEKTEEGNKRLPLMVKKAFEEREKKNHFSSKNRKERKRLNEPPLQNKPALRRGPFVGFLGKLRNPVLYTGKWHGKAFKQKMTHLARFPFL